MDMNTYKQAKYIRERIDQMRVKLNQINKMRKRDEDEDFNIVRELAHDSIIYIISRLEEDFNNL